MRPEEWRELRDLRLESLRDSPSAFWRRYDEELDLTEDEWRGRAASSCFVAVEDGRFVGMVFGAPDEDEAGIANLYAMYVQPKARGRGIGEALVQTQLAWGRASGFARVRLMVNVENGGATRLYERCGFRDTGLREPLRDGPHVLCEMTREL